MRCAKSKSALHIIKDTAVLVKQFFVFSAVFLLSGPKNRRPAVFCAHKCSCVPARPGPMPPAGTGRACISVFCVCLGACTCSRRADPKRFGWCKQFGRFWQFVKKQNRQRSFLPHRSVLPCRPFGRLLCFSPAAFCALGPACYFFGVSSCLPPIYGQSTSGILTLPSACRLFSSRAISIRGGATTVLLRVWAR